MSRGVFITFEGPEGSGKSTQIRLLAQTLRGRGRRVVVAREPGSTKISEVIRRILLGVAFEGMEPWCEAFLYMAARAQLTREIIQPALRRGAVVLCDRYLDATRAYQGYGAGLPLAAIETMGRWATSGFEPRLTFVLDLDVRLGLQRAGRPDRMERKALAFHQRVRRGYLALARRYPRRCVVVNALRSRRAIQQQIHEAVSRVL